MAHQQVVEVKLFWREKLFLLIILLKNLKYIKKTRFFRVFLLIYACCGSMPFMVREILFLSKSTPSTFTSTI